MLGGVTWYPSNVDSKEVPDISATSRNSLYERKIFKLRTVFMATLSGEVRLSEDLGTLMAVVESD